jgi:phage FluMu protein Com
LDQRKSTEKEISELITKAYQVLPELIQELKPRDLRAKQSKTSWWNRHRLIVLIDAAEETKQKIPKNIMVAPWFLVELKSVVEIINKWKKEPIWEGIKSSLKDKNHFNHTVGKLRIAEHFKSLEYNVEIVPRNKNASPDLKVQAVGGTQDWFYIECYQPSSLSGEPKKISEKNLKKIVKRTMDKAKRQFGILNPGILAIFSYNQPENTRSILKDLLIKRLDNVDRPYLAGIMITGQYILVSKNLTGISFTPVFSIDFINNPSYFGRIDISVETNESDSKLIKKPLVSIKTDELIGKKISDIKIKRKIKLVKKGKRKIKSLKLKIIEEPKPNSRAIFISGNKITFFTGEGNINHLCRNCNYVLNERVWTRSLSNIVIKCPVCDSFNEVPEIKKLEYPIKGTIGIEKGEYNFPKGVRIKQGITMFEVA